MKGIVLAGGVGSRLRPFTYSGAKQLVPVANTPVLHFPVRQLVHAGITDIALVVGETEPQIRSAMGDGSQFGARFTYVRQPAPLGIAHAVGMCREFVGDDDSFVLYLGDNVLIGGITGFAHALEESGAAASVILKEVADPRAFGVAIIDGERLVRVIEKPADPPSNLAVIGVYAFRPPVFDVIAHQTPSPRGELEIADTINGLLERRLRVDTSVTTEHWIDTGKMEDILAANRTVLDTLSSCVDSSARAVGSTLDGMVQVGPGASLESCSVHGPVVIGAGARLSGCAIGPYGAMGDGCEIAGSALTNTIVMEQSVVRSSPGIRDSMIGRFAVVTGAPAGARLTLGDHSRFEAGK
jgi:glucose-1-phosphate thymidylyltransferase